MDERYSHPQPCPAHGKHSLCLRSIVNSAFWEFHCHENIGPKIILCMLSFKIAILRNFSESSLYKYQPLCVLTVTHLSSHNSDLHFTWKYICTVFLWLHRGALRFSKPSMLNFSSGTYCHLVNTSKK